MNKEKEKSKSKGWVAGLGWANHPNGWSGHPQKAKRKTK
jgi:hypothetical protein